jgi:hypothetical protein
MFLLFGNYVFVIVSDFVFRASYLLKGDKDWIYRLT